MSMPLPFAYARRIRRITIRTKLSVIAIGLVCVSVLANDVVEPPVVIDGPPNAMPAEPARPPASDMSPHEPQNGTSPIESIEAFNYRYGVQHALMVASMYDNAMNPERSLIFVRKALRAKKPKPFDEDVSEILSIHTRTLLSIGAPIYKIEVPAIHAALESSMTLMDEAERVGLYVPPDDLRKHLDAWRSLRELDAMREKAPWLIGPQKVVIDPDVEPIELPAGYRLLLAKDRRELEAAQEQVRLAAIQKLTGKPSVPRPRRDELTHARHWLMPVDASWSASIIVLKNRHIRLDSPLPRPMNALELIRSRRDPISDLKWKRMGTYSKEAVRWLIPPEKNTARATATWAMTNGLIAEPLGIDFVQVTLGANQQVMFFTEDLKAPEVLLSIDKVYAKFTPQDKESFRAENRLNAALEPVRPLLASLQFVPEQRVERIDADPKQPSVPLLALITGEQSIMERGVERMMEEDRRKRDIWQYLKDHPRHAAALLGALGVLVAALRQMSKTKATTTATNKKGQKIAE